MSSPTNPRSPQSSQDLQRISNWSRRYAQNRSLGVVVALVIYSAVTVAIGASSFLGGLAYRAGHWFLFGLLMAILAVAMASTIFLAVPRWGGRWVVRVTERFYAAEGSARLVPPRTRGRRWAAGLLAVGFLLCISAYLTLGVLGILPEQFVHQYMQPVSAIYCVPFLVGLWLLTRPAVGPIALLWPALYALHAILIVAGVPIAFTGPYEGLNVVVPLTGYGLLAGLLSHLYSRYALRRLRRMAGANIPEKTGEQSQP